MLVRPDNESALHDLVQNLKNIGNMRIILMNLKKGVSGSTQGIARLSRSVWVAIRSVNFITSPELGTKISEIIDLNKSAEESRTVILPGVDEELDQMKRTLDGLDSLLNEVAAKLSEKMPSDLRATLNVIYFPQIGFLVTVPVDLSTGAGIYDGSFEDRWERMFATE
ncbi:hypothetical protein J1614_009148 [Plenodomus biglobosus]|nr:hypothetical protein J1614_009148 [Plenodomus biglobosus]